MVSDLFDKFRSRSASPAASCCAAVFGIVAFGFPAAMLLTIMNGGRLHAEEMATLPDEHVRYFESEIRPLLVEHCYECHSKQFDEVSGELRLDSAAAIARGGLSGKTIIPGKPNESLLIEVVRYESDMQMPPEGKLNDEAIAALEKWVTMGAPDPRTDEQESESPEISPIQRDPKEHWTFNSPKRPVAPQKTLAPVADVVDAFVLAAAEKQQIKVNGRTNDGVLIRRLYFDLTGLPPAKSGIDDFVASTKVNKYERLVDRLIATPDFSERFARHWLDVARYADTLGYATAGKDRRYKGSHRYRDWVVDAIGKDMPYDEMVMHQIAGDRTDPENLHGNLDAMGFLTLGRKFLNGFDTTDDRIDVITRGLLGLTVSCARCHDHKFDPIPTSDYYALFGVLRSSTQPDDGPSPLMMKDSDKPRDHHVMLRGQPGNRGPIAPRQFLTSLRTDDSRFRDGSGRLELAKQITRSDSPLFARVLVNRVWGWVTGKPLVDSPSDFGFRTQPPAVPEVLEELAVEFSQDRSIKRLVRRIVLTDVYQRSSEVDEAKLNADPENDFMARANRRRRDFESLRDSLLVAADSMNRRMGGEPVEINLGTPVPRRSIYAMIDRQNLPSLFRTFDFPDPNAHSSGRYFTTVPQQSLYLMNSPQVIELAKRTARSARRAAGDGPEANKPGRLIESLFRQTLGREPSPTELAQAKQFLKSKAKPLEARDDPRDAWSYGIGEMDADGKVVQFEPMTFFSGSQWQPTKDFPSKSKYGYALLAKENGHTPNDSSLAVVRRFKSPVDGDVYVSGQVGHRNQQGDGVRMDIYVGKKRIHRRTEKSSNTPFGKFRASIKEGQTVDFVISNGKSSSFDSFFLRTTLQIKQGSRTAFETNSVKHFSGPIDKESRKAMSRYAQLAQVLLISNEFIFVD